MTKFSDMSITNLLTQWRSNAEKYSAEARRVFKRIKRAVEADKPSGSKLDDLVDEIGKTFTNLLFYCLLFYYSLFYYLLFFQALSSTFSKKSWTSLR